MQEVITVDNIKCGGCANSIQTKLQAIDGVDQVAVDVASGTVTVTGATLQRPLLTERLKSLGYPETDSVAGVAALTAKAKSFVSCAVGRMEK